MYVVIIYWFALNGLSVFSYLTKSCDTLDTLVYDLSKLFSTLPSLESYSALDIICMVLRYAAGKRPRILNFFVLIAWYSVDFELFKKML